MPWANNLSQLTRVDFSAISAHIAYQTSVAASDKTCAQTSVDKPMVWQSQPWAFADLIDLKKISAHLGVQASSTSDPHIVPTEQPDSGAVAEQAPSAFSGVYDLQTLGGSMGTPASPKPEAHIVPVEPQEPGDKAGEATTTAFGFFEAPRIRIGPHQGAKASPEAGPERATTGQEHGSVAEKAAAFVSGFFDLESIRARLGVQASPNPGAQTPPKNETSPEVPQQPERQTSEPPGTQPPPTGTILLESDVGAKPAFSGLFAEAGEEPSEIVGGVHVADDVQQPEGVEAADVTLDGLDQGKMQESKHRIIRPQANLDNEEAMDEHAVAPWDPALDAEDGAEATQAGTAPLESHSLGMTREDLISHWAPFSSYFHPGMQVAIAPSPGAGGPPESNVQMPEGFIVLSVQHHESVADATDISIGRYFYFDASPFPTFEFSPYSCFVEQWRQGQLFWSGQVQLSLGAYGSADLPEVPSPAAGRKDREESMPGDFEVGDLIFVVGFHRDFANTNGKHVEFAQNLHFYQASCIGSRVPFNVSSSLYADNLADLGQRVPLGIEVDEQELAAVRPVVVAVPSAVAKANVNTIMKSAAHTTDLSESSFALSQDIPNEGGAGKINSSAAWAARRKDFLRPGLKSLERRVQEAPYI